MISHRIKVKSDLKAKVWYNELGECHREDGPAWINNRGLYWYRHNTLHRTDGPARILKDPDQIDWIVNGKVITHTVQLWLDETGYNYPLSNEQEMEFKLRFL